MERYVFYDVATEFPNININLSLLTDKQHRLSCYRGYVE
jgi:hypothetical protein